MEFREDFVIKTEKTQMWGSAIDFGLRVAGGENDVYIM